MKRRGAWIPAVIVVLVSSSAALAQNDAAAEGLFKAGIESLKAKDYDAACSRFRESDRLDPAPGTKLALADCEERRGKVATAWALYRAGLEKLPPDDKRVAKVRERIERVEPHVPKLTITLATDAPKDLVAREGDLLVSGASIGIPLSVDPGEHVFTVSSDGYSAATFRIRVEEGKSARLEVAPGPKEAPKSEPIAPPPIAPAPIIAPAPVESVRGLTTESPSRSHTGAWIALGLGATLGAGGAVSWILAHQEAATAADHCNDKVRLCDSAGRSAIDRGTLENTLGAVGVIGGAVGVGVGTWLFATSGGTPSVASVGAPMVGPGRLGWSLHGSF